MTTTAKQLLARLEEGLALHPVPVNSESGLRHWVLDHTPPGGFVTAVLENNLQRSFWRADSSNLKCLHAWVHLLSYLPPECYGSPKKVKAWAEGGTQGRPLIEVLTEQDVDEPDEFNRGQMEEDR